MRNKIILTIGVSCSGKTTWAKQQMLENNKLYYVSRDEERLSTFGEYGMGNQKEENTITLICQNKIDCLLTLGDVIVDNTNLDMKYIQHYLDKYSNVEFKVFPLIDKPTFVERNNERFNKTGKLIPEKVFFKQCKQYNSLDASLLMNKVSKSNKKRDIRIKGMTANRIRQTTTPLPDCIICDLDGTLSLMNGRSPFSGKDCGSDLVHDPVESILDLVGGSTYTRTQIILMSGRNSDKGGREATEKWLSDNGITYDKLHMRKEGDTRSDVIIKREMYKEHIEGKYNVLFCLDDRPCVIRLWSSLGLPVFDVNPMSGEF